tara:strand:- start:394 stop:510 length:117 start_codon:yes stop_codon:yes gene_type:complete
MPAGNKYVYLINGSSNPETLLKNKLKEIRIINSRNILI